ncbi:MAG: transketolase C-terminal domain-containing protein, partial [Pseudomonadota bacterium]
IGFRYPRGEGLGLDMPEAGTLLEIGKGRVIQEGNDIALLSYGTRLNECQKAALVLEERGHSVTIADARFAKPLDEDLVRTLAKNHHTLITIEEGSIGGFSSYVLECLNRNGLMDGNLKVRTMHLPDSFLDQDSPATQYKTAQLLAEDILEKA